MKMKRKKKSWKYNIKIKFLFGNVIFVNICVKMLVLKVIDDNKQFVCGIVCFYKRIYFYEKKICEMMKLKRNVSGYEKMILGYIKYKSLWKIQNWIFLMFEINFFLIFGKLMNRL